MNKKRNFWAAAVILFILLPVFFACENNVIDVKDVNVTDDTEYEFNSPLVYSAEGPGVAPILGYIWTEVDPVLNLRYTFNNNGTVSVVHCCGLVVDGKFSYLFKGNIMVTYGVDTHKTKTSLASTTFDMVRTYQGTSFARNNGQEFKRGDKSAASSSGTSMVLSNNLLGTWQEYDGTEYVFNTDASLQMGSAQYGYLVRNNELLTLGPLVDGEPAVVQKYQFIHSGSTLTLTSSDGKQYSLSRSQ